MATELSEELLEINERSNSKTHKQGQARCVVLHGQGEKAFCGGADLKDRKDMTPEQWEVQHKSFRNMAISLYNLKIPCIAACNGHAFGGGLEILFLCDWVIASEKAKFCLPETKLGVFSGLGAPILLPRLIGKSAATRLQLLGHVFDSKEGKELGLFSQITPDSASCIEAAMAEANTIAKNSPMATRGAKASIKMGLFADSFEQGWKESMVLYNECVASNERKEGIQAYHEKRTPKF